MAVGVGIGIIGLLTLLFTSGLTILHIILCVWAYRDARRHGKSTEYALLVLIGLFFFPILGLIIYLLIRND